jgi:hypothetical protein
MGCGLAEGALDFIRKRIAEMSSKCKTLESKMLLVDWPDSQRKVRPYPP